MTGVPGAPNRTILIPCVMLAVIMQILDTTMATIALPYMMGELSATLDQINWVLTSYIVAAAISTPLSGYLANRFGRRRVLMTTITGFTIASMLSGMATSLEQMVVFRLMQGMFGAPLVPLSQATMLDTYPREQHGSAMALFGVGVMVGPVLGPTLGGILTEFFHWRWVFTINVPVGIVAFLGLSAAMPRTEPKPIGFDWFGFATLGIAVGSFQLMLDRGERLNWFNSTLITTLAFAAALSFYLFVVHTATARRPFIDPRLFQDRNFTLGMCFIFVVGILLLATIALLSPFLQTMLGYPVLTAGLITSPRGLGTMISMLLVGRLITRVDPRLLLSFGFGCAAVSLWEMSGFTPQVSQAAIIRTGMVQGFGLGFMFVPLTTMTFSTLAPELRNQATAMYALMRNVGASIGIAVVIFLLVRDTQVINATLVQHVTPFNPALRLPGVAELWSLDTVAGRMALAEMVYREARAIAYMNDFRLLALLALAAMPMTALLRRPGPRRPVGATG
ncbi:DHA2 family efflux MFS transporter permease subunit [Elioraea tepidiphila]|jgi:DHA2 family multidrug resistance protein|uniref:DHA2 family efflux MFS transporter permease subunit n=1 Tax=Elioraea tepidiphila TaxID=457934 RepID=UPI00036E505A|nr:DHA2 family efflux MFS transporter permease subunit [Elioraea tepidiphila]